MRLVIGRRTLAAASEAALVRPEATASVSACASSLLSVNGVMLRR